MSSTVKDMPLVFDIMTYSILVYTFYSYMSEFATGAGGYALMIGAQSGLLWAVFFQIAKIGSIMNNK